MSHLIIKASKQLLTLSIGEYLLRRLLGTVMQKRGLFLLKEQTTDAFLSLQTLVKVFLYTKSLLLNRSSLSSISGGGDKMGISRREDRDPKNGRRGHLGPLASPLISQFQALGRLSEGN